MTFYSFFFCSSLVELAYSCSRLTANLVTSHLDAAILVRIVHLVRNTEQHLPCRHTRRHWRFPERLVWGVASRVNTHHLLRWARVLVHRRESLIWVGLFGDTSTLVMLLDLSSKRGRRTHSFVLLGRARLLRLSARLNSPYLVNEWPLDLRVWAGRPLRIRCVRPINYRLLEGCMLGHGTLPLRLQLLAKGKIDYYPKYFTSAFVVSTGRSMPRASNP